MESKKKENLDVPVYLFHEGSNARAYELLGAHRTGKNAVTFRVWAPHAVSVSVVGGVLHNVGQIIVACFVTSTSELVYYLPVLFISGTLSGIVIGLIAGIIVKRFEKIKL